MRNSFFPAIFPAIFSMFAISLNAQPTTSPTSEPNLKLNTAPTTAATQQDPNAFAQLVNNAQGEQMPSITNEIMQDLFKTLTNIDYTFLGAEFTMSADGDNAKRNLMHISTRAAKKLTGDKPKALVFYSANGNMVLQAEVYFGDDQLHQYLVFLKDGKPFAANYMSPAGVTFFKQVVGAKVEAKPSGEPQTAAPSTTGH